MLLTDGWAEGEGLGMDIRGLSSCAEGEGAEEWGLSSCAEVRE